MLQDWYQAWEQNKRRNSNDVASLFHKAESYLLAAEHNGEEDVIQDIFAMLMRVSNRF